MNVLHISDIHFRESYLPCEEGYQGMLAAMQNPLIPLEECIQDAKARVAIDLVVISGDLTEDGACRLCLFEAIFRKSLWLSAHRSNAR